jgi:hypothetical protein
LKSGRPRGPGNAFKSVGGKTPTFWKVFPGLRGQSDFKNAPKNLARLSKGALAVVLLSILHFWAEQKQVKKWQSSWFPVLILGAF